MKTNTKQSIAALVLAGIMAMPFTLAAGEPEDVNNVSASSKDATTLTVSWDEAEDSEGNAVDHYRIYYGTESVLNGDASSYDIEVDTTDDSTEYDLTSLETGTMYYLSVTAIDGNDVESLNYSIEASGTPEAEVVAETAEAPEVTDAISVDMNHVLVGFSEEVKLPELLAEAAFTITEQINPSNLLEVTSAMVYEDDPENKTIILETASQTKNVNYIVTASVAITDMDGNPIDSGNFDSALFLGTDIPAEEEEVVEEPAEEEVMAEEETTEVVDDAAEELLEETPTEEVDTTAPEDITNLLLTYREELEKFVVMMNWTPSLNSAKDLVDQILYQSTDLGSTYDSGKSLGITAKSTEVAGLEPETQYTFKITTKDAAGNESVGAVKSIRLPQTGMGAGMLLFGSVLGAKRALRRKRKDVF